MCMCVYIYTQPARNRRGRCSVRMNTIFLLIIVFLVTCNAVTKRQQRLGLTASDLLHVDVGLGEKAADAMNFAEKHLKEDSEAFTNAYNEILQTLHGQYSPEAMDALNSPSDKTTEAAKNVFKAFASITRKIRKNLVDIGEAVSPATITKCMQISEKGAEHNSHKEKAQELQCATLMDMEAFIGMAQSPFQKPRTTQLTQVLKGGTKAFTKLKRRLKKMRGKQTKQQHLGEEDSPESESARFAEASAATQNVNADACQRCMGKCDLAATNPADECVNKARDCLNKCTQHLSHGQDRQLECVKRAQDRREFGFGISLSGGAHATAFVGVHTGATFRMDFDTMQYGFGVFAGAHATSEIAVGAGGQISVHAKLGNAVGGSGFQGHGFSYFVGFGFGTIIKTASIGFSVGVKGKMYENTLNSGAKIKIPAPDLTDAPEISVGISLGVGTGVDSGMIVSGGVTYSYFPAWSTSKTRSTTATGGTCDTEACWLAAAERGLVDTVLKKKEKKGLSTGAKVGIGVGLVVIGPVGWIAGTILAVQAAPVVIGGLVLKTAAERLAVQRARQYLMSAMMFNLHPRSVCERERESVRVFVARVRV